jgi:two-component system sensor histidine kinase DegS
LLSSPGQVKNKIEAALENLDKVEIFLKGLNDLKNLNSKIIKAQEKERKKIANEVHDGPAQSLANVVMQMDILEKIIKKSPETALKEIEEMRSIIKSSLGEVRKFIFDLRPMTLDDLGLIPTIKRFIENFKKRRTHSIFINLEIKGIQYRLSQDIETCFFRILQESLNNVIKHSKAESVKICVYFTKTILIMIIHDNGIGFDVENISRSYSTRESLGLVSMMERAELIDADLSIESAANEGTKVTLSLKVNPKILKKPF